MAEDFTDEELAALFSGWQPDSGGYQYDIGTFDPWANFDWNSLNTEFNDAGGVVGGYDPLAGIDWNAIFSGETYDDPYSDAERASLNDLFSLWANDSGLSFTETPDGGIDLLGLEFTPEERAALNATMNTWGNTSGTMDLPGTLNAITSGIQKVGTVDGGNVWKLPDGKFISDSGTIINQIPGTQPGTFTFQPTNTPYTQPGTQPGTGDLSSVLTKLTNWLGGQTSGLPNWLLGAQGIGSLLDSGDKTTTQTVRSDLPDWAKPGAAQLQSKALSLLGGSPTDYKTEDWYQTLGKTQGLIDRGAVPFSADALSVYQNPYIESVLDRAAGKLKESQAIESNKMASDWAKKNALGGSRYALESDLVKQRQGQQLADLYTQGYANAFDKASTLFTTDANRMQGLAGLQTGLAGAQKAGADRTYEDPFKRLATSAAAFKSTLPGSSTTTETSTPGGSTAAQLTGLAGLLASTMGK